MFDFLADFLLAGLAVLVRVVIGALGVGAGVLIASYRRLFPTTDDGTQPGPRSRGHGRAPTARRARRTLSHRSRRERQAFRP